MTHPTITVSLDMENHYPDETVHTSTTDITVAAPPCVIDSEALDEWAFDTLFPYTGTGRTDGDSAYLILVTASSEPTLVGRIFEFG